MTNYCTIKIPIFILKENTLPVFPVFAESSPALSYYTVAVTEITLNPVPVKPGVKHSFLNCQVYLLPRFLFRKRIQLSLIIFFTSSLL